MSKRVSNSRSNRKRGDKISARQTVRYGWRKRKAHAVIAYMREQLRLAKMAEASADA